MLMARAVITPSFLLPPLCPAPPLQWCSPSWPEEADPASLSLISITQLLLTSSNDKLLGAVEYEEGVLAPTWRVGRCVLARELGKPGWPVLRVLDDDINLPAAHRKTLAVSFDCSLYYLHST